MTTPASLDLFRATSLLNNPGGKVHISEASIGNLDATTISADNNSELLLSATGAVLNPPSGVGEKDITHLTTVLVDKVSFNTADASFTAPSRGLYEFTFNSTAGITGSTTSATVRSRFVVNAVVVKNQQIAFDTTEPINNKLIHMRGVVQLEANDSCKFKLFYVAEVGTGTNLTNTEISVSLIEKN